MREVTTQEDLDELPADAVIRCDDGVWDSVKVYEKIRGAWYTPGDDVEVTPPLPATLLWPHTCAGGAQLESPTGEGRGSETERHGEESPGRLEAARKERDQALAELEHMTRWRDEAVKALSDCESQRNKNKAVAQRDQLERQLIETAPTCNQADSLEDYGLWTHPDHPGWVGLPEEVPGNMLAWKQGLNEGTPLRFKAHAAFQNYLAPWTIQAASFARAYFDSLKPANCGQQPSFMPGHGCLESYDHAGAHRIRVGNQTITWVTDAE